MNFFGQDIDPLFDRNQDQDQQDQNTQSHSFKFPRNNNNQVRESGQYKNQQKFQENMPIKQKPKVFMPQQFHKGKRTLNKIILNYFNNLKAQYINFKDSNCIIYNRFQEIQNVVTAIKKYVGIRHQKRSFLDIKIPYNAKKQSNQLRNGAFCYQAQTEKIINYTKKGQINQIKIDFGTYKLPSLATPVPFKENIYLFDPVNFDKKLKIFIPDKISYKITQKGQLQQLVPGPSIQRMKCAIVKDEKNIFLLGGYAGQSKFITKRCEKYYPTQKKFEEMPELINSHNSPSAIIMSNKIWVFSQSFIQYFQRDKNKWANVRKPFGLIIYPFQFLAQLSEKQILIFGGIKQNRKVSQVQVFNIQKLYSDSYDEILPQGVCSERIWGPTMVENNIVVLSNVQAQVYPQVGTKKNVFQVIYITSNGLYLHSLVTQK